MPDTPRSDDKDRILDRAKELADAAGEKVRDVFTEHGDKIDDAVDKAGEFIDDKTKRRFSERIGKVQHAAHTGVRRLQRDADRSDDPGES